MTLELVANDFVISLRPLPLPTDTFNPVEVASTLALLKSPAQVPADEPSISVAAQFETVAF
jgi:hypothetical protein